MTNTTEEDSLYLAVSSYGGPLNLDVAFKRSWLSRKAVLATDHLPNLRMGKLVGLVLPVDSLDDIRMALAEVSESGGQLVLASTGQDLVAARENGRFAIVLCASYRTIGEDLGQIPFLRRLGVRLFTFSSNRRNLLADGCGERNASGLSYLGIEAVKELERCGIFPDVSHLSDGSFWDLVDHSRGPIIASHSNARALCDHPRNLTDAQIEAIAGRGGLIGVSTYPTLVAERDASVEHLLRHVDYMAELAGTEHLAIGTDLVDFMEPSFEAALSRADPGGNLYRKDHSGPVTAGVGRYSEVCNVVDGLAKRGYSTQQVNMILYQNLARLLDAVSQESAS